jgi:ABC-type amino acid transport substrate-binding protein
MSKFFFAFVATLFFTLPDLFAQGNDAVTWNEIRSKKTGVLTCLWNESYGIIYKNKTGEMKGVCADILSDFTKFIKDKYDAVVTVSYREEKVYNRFLLVVAQSPTLLGVSSVTITEERKKTYQFSPAYLANPNMLISNRYSKPISKLQDLSTTHSNFKMKVIRGSSHEQYANALKQKYNPKLVIELSSSSREIFDEMKTNESLFTISDCGEFLGAKLTNKEITLQKVDLGLVDRMAFIMHKRSDWASLFQEFLTDDYRASVRYKKIINDNLGSNYLSVLK